MYATASKQKCLFSQRNFYAELATAAAQSVFASSAAGILTP